MNETSVLAKAASPRSVAMLGADRTRYVTSRPERKASLSGGSAKASHTAQWAPPSSSDRSRSATSRSSGSGRPTSALGQPSCRRARPPPAPTALPPAVWMLSTPDLRQADAARRSPREQPGRGSSDRDRRCAVDRLAPTTTKLPPLQHPPSRRPETTRDRQRSARSWSRCQSSRIRGRDATGQTLGSRGRGGQGRP